MIRSDARHDRACLGAIEERYEQKVMRKHDAVAGFSMPDSGDIILSGFTSSRICMSDLSTHGLAVPPSLASIP